MNKLFLIFILLSVFIFNSQAETVAGKDSLKTNVVQADPWTKETGLRYSMPLLVRVYKDNVLFQPAGALLGVFKDNKCWGYAGIGTSPVGPIFNVTMGYNAETATGFTYKLYDPATQIIYSILETVDFKDAVPVGKINAPVSLHVSGVSAIKEINEARFSVYPNPIENEFKIVIDSNSDGKTFIQLYNFSGQFVSELFRGETPNSQLVTFKRDVNLLSGIYFIKVIEGQTFSVKKVVLK